MKIEGKISTNFDMAKVLNTIYFIRAEMLLD